MSKGPLVSVLIPNRNHSQFLAQAIESALAQTYDNIEIIVCDNCSNDNSLEIAMKYLEQGVIINKNPINIFSYNYQTLANLMSGKYFILLCADDVVKPTFIERAVSIMEEYSNIGYVHCERDYIDEYGNITELDTFFNCSFIAPGKSMLPIYMLTDVGQAAQTLIRRTAFDDVGGHDTDTDYSNIDRELWFRLSMSYDYAYIREKLSLVRVHSLSETSNTTDSFVHPLSIYVMLKGFLEWARINNYPNVLEREAMAFNKLSIEILNTAVNALKAGKLALGKQYMLFACILNKDISENENYQQCLNGLKLGRVDSADSIIMTDSRFLFRTRNYEPPKDYIRL